ncbi:AraC family transcriptional regulator [uncultured Clostridium sp.]|uniref:AraC family transcriptional regulator n=1 Tax=uncultured Clostridium sp. TaxID=59620 RepID=UPI002600D3D8|nr:AraC family transcriptional regulator [uncultured Clostridium sp.]MDU4884189.1 AraC family transcriptional regulator [Clostridium celatum]MDU7077398.1 AraC family transcriptional regulator [Clostridium celatum]
MLDVYFLENTNRNFNDLYLCYCGLEKCAPLYSFGPAVRPTYLLHYVLDGQGYYYVNDTKYTVSKNQGFLIEPNVVTFYQADKDNPWTYLWIGIDGDKAKLYLNSAGLNENHLIFTYEKDDSLKEYVLEMLKHHTMSDSDAFKIEGLLYLFFSKLCEDRKEISSMNKEENTNNYINKAIEFIQNNYHNSIKVTDIANYICLNRSYLTSIFQNNLNMSPQKFLMKFRITKAAELLYNTNLPITNIAYSCGYSDPLAFSKAFKKLKGVSPKEYRNTKRENTQKFLLFE